MVRHGREARVRHADRGQTRHQPDPLLLGAGAGQVGEERVLLHQREARAGVADAVRVQQPAAQRQHPGAALGVGHLERVLLVRRDPLGVGVHRLVGQLDPVRGEGPRHLRGGHRPVGQRGGRLRGEGDAGREAPHPVVHHPDRQAEGLVVAAGLQVAVPEAAVRQQRPDDPDVGMAAAEGAGAGQRGVGQRSQRQRREGLVDPAHPLDPSGLLRQLVAPIVPSRGPVRLRVCSISRGVVGVRLRVCSIPRGVVGVRLRACSIPRGVGIGSVRSG